MSQAGVVGLSMLLCVILLVLLALVGSTASDNPSLWWDKLMTPTVEGTR
jgi:hypothetical protein